MKTEYKDGIRVEVKCKECGKGATMNRTQTMNRVDKVRLIIEQEIMDGCNDCKNGGACTTHHLFFLELAINPRKYINLDRWVMCLKSQQG